ncbi:MAG TPA: SRPBCC domain-containing protein [Candidatus Dormibacteraeota bacterium]
MSDLARISDQPSVRVNRLLSAPIDEVYAAWTDPAFMCRWFSPTGRAEVEVDVRVGGSLRVVMLGDGMRIDHTGEYLVVEPPRRLIFTWNSPYTGSESSIVTVVLTPQGERTHLALSHDRLPQETTESHEGGWTSIVAHLAAALGGSMSPHQEDLTPNGC